MRLFPRSLAGQVFVLQLLVIGLIVIAGGSLALLDARRDGDAAARAEVIGIASALADSPATAEAIVDGTATAVLQPVTEKIRADTGVAFITIMAPDRTRFTHTDPTLIGADYIGHIEPALAGTIFTEVYTGTLGPSIRAVAPVRDESGNIVGLVSTGITQRSLAQNWRHEWPPILAITVGALGASFIGFWAIRRRVRRQTHGLGPAELRLMYDHHDAILHSVSEGLIVLDRTGVALVNDEARRLLSLPGGDTGKGETGKGETGTGGAIDKDDLPHFLRSYSPGARDEVHVTGDRVLVVNRSQVPGEQSPDTEVVTIRDRTELQGALGELDSMKIFAESLRSQAHESANRLHTIVTLVEMGRGEDAVQFATTELALSQQLVDRLATTVDEPALAALLLGKSAQADERGIHLTVTDDTELSSEAAESVLSGQELVTVVGNLIDNALDACDRDDPWVEVTVRQEAQQLLIQVADSGPGMDAGQFERAMQRGYSTKSGSEHGRRGLGLALVAQVVNRHHGTISAEVTYGSVVTVTFERQRR